MFTAKSDITEENNRNKTLQNLTKPKQRITNKDLIGKGLKRI